MSCCTRRTQGQRLGASEQKLDPHVENCGSIVQDPPDDDVRSRHASVRGESEADAAQGLHVNLLKKQRSRCRPSTLVLGKLNRPIEWRYRRPDSFISQDVDIVTSLFRPLLALLHANLHVKNPHNSYMADEAHGFLQ